MAHNGALQDKVEDNADADADEPRGLDGASPSSLPKPQSRRAAAQPTSLLASDSESDHSSAVSVDVLRIPRRPRLKTPPVADTGSDASDARMSAGISKRTLGLFLNDDEGESVGSAQPEASAGLRPLVGGSDTGIDDTRPVPAPSCRQAPEHTSSLTQPQQSTQKRGLMFVSESDTD